MRGQAADGWAGWPVIPEAAHLKTRLDHAATRLVSLFEQSRADRFTDPEGVIDDMGAAKEAREDRERGTVTRGSGWLACATMAPDVAAWTRQADSLVFLLACDPVGLLPELRRIAGPRPYPAHIARYVDEVEPRVAAAAERQMAMRERREIAEWARWTPGAP